ncbi:equilibrative nucleobase transporter 1-like [Uloborus diversus]|uniref:equilibrative nucleobase transporter 1-like n=1 Tax=Uloborus diversus TaxID=327109 RepID=UPI002409A793|nr:equilibrative nucleobase transporter 1-like [Uloborus diversus]
MRQLTRHFLLWYGLLETFVFTGNIFGWTALHYMLRKEGIYEQVCEEESLSVNTSGWNATFWDTNLSSPVNKSIATPTYRTCEEQDRILNLAYTIGSFCMGSTSFIWGFLLDKWGLRIVRIIINGLITSGCILLSLTIKETSFFLFPSLILMCTAGIPLRLANMQIADLFPKYRSTIITLYSGACSASASIFVFIKYGFDAGLPWEWACFLLVVLSVLMLPVTLFLLPADRVKEEDSKGGLFPSPQKEVSSVAPFVWGTFTYILDELPFTKASMASEKKDPKKDMNLKKKEAEAELRVKERPLRESLLSASFMMHQYWFCWLLLYTIIYIGTLHLWIDRTTTDPDEDSLFSEVYGLSQVTGLFLAPIGGIFMDWSIRRVAKKEGDGEQNLLRVIRSCFWPMFLTTVLEMIAQVCKFFNTNSAIYVSIVAVTMLRAFFLSIGTAYLRIRFPAEHFNRLLGIMSTISAIISLFQYPLFLWESSSPKNALYVNVFDTFCLAVAFIHPILLVVTPVQKYFLRRNVEKQDTKSSTVR